MKASILAIFVAAAAAQGSATTTALTPQQSCLSACTPSDVNCQAICVGVPHPGEAQMGLVTDCVAACDQGDGSTAASEAYGRCRDSCLSSYIILSGTAAPGGAYTTAIPPGVSVTAAAADASASADSAGRMTVATFLIPVDHSIARLYHPRWSYVTVEVYPYPIHVLDRLGCNECDRIVTLSYGQEFSYLPTPYHACPACPTAAPTHPGPVMPSSTWSHPVIGTNPSSVVAPNPTGPPSSVPKPTGPPSSAPKSTGPASGALVPTGKPANSTAAPAGPLTSWEHGGNWNNGRPYTVTIRVTETINGTPCPVTVTMRDHQTQVVGSGVCGVTSFQKTYNVGDLTASNVHGPASNTRSAPVRQSDGAYAPKGIPVGKVQGEESASGHAGISSSGKDNRSRTVSSAASDAAASTASRSGSAASASTSNAAVGAVTVQYGGVFGMLLGALALL